MELEELCRKIGEYQGVARKRGLGAALAPLALPPGGPEDAGVVEHGDEALLLAADGIMPELVEADPWWAGFCGVLVNLHDIAAMGGEALALVDVVSTRGQGGHVELIRGLRDAAERFGVPVVSGHLHPDAPYEAVDVMVLGRAPAAHLVRSGTARPGDVLIYAVDLDGQRRPTSPWSWDSVSRRPGDVLRCQLGFVPHLAREGMATAAKDVSNPGLVGTLAMMLEARRLGAVVRLEEVPNPNIPYYPWLLLYPGMGFLAACAPERRDDVLGVAREHLLSARVIGDVNPTGRLELELRGQRCCAFDLRQGGLTGLG